MNFDNIRINNAYAEIYGRKATVNESIQKLRKVKAEKCCPKCWKLVDASSGKTIQSYGFLENLKKDVKESGYLLVNDVDESANDDKEYSIFDVDSGLVIDGNGHPVGGMLYMLTYGNGEEGLDSYGLRNEILNILRFAYPVKSADVRNATLWEDEREWDELQNTLVRRISETGSVALHMFVQSLIKRGLVKFYPSKFNPNGVKYLYYSAPTSEIIVFKDEKSVSDFKKYAIRENAIDEADTLKRSPARIKAYGTDERGDLPDNRTLDGKINLRGKAAKLRDRELSAASHASNIVGFFEKNSALLEKLEKDLETEGLYRAARLAEELLAELDWRSYEAKDKLIDLNGDVHRTYHVGQKGFGDGPNTVQHESTTANEAAEITWEDGKRERLGGIYSPQMLNEWIRYIASKNPVGYSPRIKSAVINGKTYTAEELASDTYSTPVGEASTDDPKTKVFFIKTVEPNSGDEEIVAIFPDESWNPENPDEVTSYVHFGQHGPASIKWANEQPLATKEEYAELYDELVNRVGYNLDVIESGVNEAGYGDSEGENKAIFTLNIQDISDEGRSIDDMKWATTYYDFDEACDAAMACAREYASDGDVINVSVMAGEYEKPNGDVYGDPEGVYTVSNKDEAETAAAREKANFVQKYVDGYATDRLPTDGSSDADK